MEVLVAAGAFFVVLLLQWWSHRDERRAWEKDRAMLLDRIQAPMIFEARAAEATEKGSVSYIGDESDTDGLTGDRGSDETAEEHP